MIKNDLFNLVKIFDEIKNISSNPKFAYMVAKNRKIIEAEIDVIKEAIKPDDSMAQYDESRIALCRTYAKLDENNNPIVANSNFVIDPERVKDFNKEIEKLREEYKATLDEHKTRIMEVDKLLREEIELDFSKVSIDHFPDGLTQEQYEILMVFAMD